MAILTLNSAHRQAIANETGARFNGGGLQVRTGPPAGADNSPAGTLLVTLNISDPAFSALGGGLVANNDNWSGTVIVSGPPGNYRLVSADAQEVREGDAAEVPGTGQGLLFDGLQSGDLVSGGVVIMVSGAFTLTQPSGA